VLRFSKNEILHGVFSLTFAPDVGGELVGRAFARRRSFQGYRFYAAPGYYYRGDHMKLDDANWHCFTLSRYDRKTGEWAMEKAPVYHIID